MMTLGAEQQGYIEASSPTEAVSRHRAFDGFKHWVVGLAKHPRPTAGFGGPVETPFANSIPTPENQNLQLTSTAIDSDGHLTSAEVANAIRTSYDGNVVNGSVSGYLGGGE